MPHNKMEIILRFANFKNYVSK